MNPKYPDVVVQLSGEDGNVFAIGGRVGSALKRAGVEREEISQFYAEMSAGTYDDALQTVFRWVTVE
jgi:hypothetical protein